MFFNCIYLASWGFGCPVMFRFPNIPRCAGAILKAALPQSTYDSRIFATFKLLPSIGTVES